MNPLHDIREALRGKKYQALTYEFDVGDVKSMGLAFVKLKAAAGVASVKEINDVGVWEIIDTDRPGKCAVWALIAVNRPG